MSIILQRVCTVTSSYRQGCLRNFMCRRFRKIVSDGRRKTNTTTPKIADNWRDKWVHLSTYFKYPQAVRTLIYTTNTIEGFNRQLRKVTKNKGVFPTDDSLFKMLYLAMMDITKKWTGRRRDWGEIHSQLEIFFADRISY